MQGIFLYILLYTYLICVVESYNETFVRVHKSSNISLKCLTDNISFTSWNYPLTNTSESKLNSVLFQKDNRSLTLLIQNVTFDNEGVYTCYVSNNISSPKQILVKYSVTVYGKPTVHDVRNVRMKATENAILRCSFTGNPVPNATWNFTLSDNRHVINHEFIHKGVMISLQIQNVSAADNGTYQCLGLNSEGEVSANVHLTVLDKCTLQLDQIISFGKRSIFLNWTVNDGNSRLHAVHIEYLENGTKEWIKVTETPEKNHKIFEHLKENHPYKFRLYGENEVGFGEMSKESEWISTLSTEPVFKPALTIKGTSPNSITVGWNSPPHHLLPFMHYYLIQAFGREITLVKELPILSQDYVWSNLKPAEDYNFMIQACSNYSLKCGPLSDTIIGTTMDGESSAPTSVHVHCQLDNSSLSSILSVTWKKPIHPSGKIVSYRVAPFMVLTEKISKSFLNVYSYYIEMGCFFKINVNSSSSFLNERGFMEKVEWPLSLEVDGEAYEYHMKVKPHSNYTVEVCAITRIEECGNRSQVTENSKCVMPATVPSNLPIIFWEKTNLNSRKVFKLTLPRITEQNGPICCFRVFVVRLHHHHSVQDLPAPSIIAVSSYHKIHHQKLFDISYLAEVFSRELFQKEIIIGDEIQVAELPQCEICFNNSLPLKKIKSSVRHQRSSITDNEYSAVDGVLDDESNYTGYLEVIVQGPGGQPFSLRSSYFMTMESIIQMDATSNYYKDLTLTLGILVGLLVIGSTFVLFLMLKKSKQLTEEHGVAMKCNSSLWYCWQNLRGKHLGYLISQEIVQVAPVSKKDLVAVFLKLRKDSDFGFQNEFEQLSDILYTATTKACDKLENSAKNRYPDIKVFDHTRVVLSLVDGDPNSDYINANFVAGYKGEKIFICAQGPLDKTVQDFWRMIWEQRVHTIVMLTNLEEHGKMKCAHYWPSEGCLNFDDIQVTYVSEKPFSDFIVRHLKVEKENFQRHIKHYHYISWKDFLAPEHPFGILKFLKRINDDYTPDLGPILVHCSAGVGRTGTFVAIDSLMQQLQNENSINVFQTICEMRKQRNYLVQSLKQYIFVYRALLELAQFGYTEMQLQNFLETFQSLENLNSSGKSFLEEEFENLSKVIEDRKSISIGTSELNSVKNRHDFAIPYDTNCVLLTPLPSCLEATYINASHIQGYDHSVKYIVAQDPLDSTIFDFWRMIFDHNIGIMVMLSEDGKEKCKCPQYWPDQAEKQYDSLSIILESLVTMPNYIRREFSVTNTKMKETNKVIQFQYLGWYGDFDQVPSSTKTVLELIKQLQQHQEKLGAGTVLVHCSAGARSSLFLSISILLQQLKNEDTIDIFQTVRNLRSQRLFMMQSFNQYRFCYQAIADYLKESA